MNLTLNVLTSSQTMHHLLSPVIDFTNNVLLIYRDVHAARVEKHNIYQNIVSVEKPYLAYRNSDYL